MAAITFQASGLHTLTRVDGLPTREGMKALWDNVGAFRDGIGVYLLGTEKAGSITPWYVGKTDKGFKKRFSQHLVGLTTFSRLRKSVPKGDLVVILIARTTPRGKLKKARRPRALTTTKAIKSIERLEYEMIGLCHAKNAKLINRSNRVFQEGFSVPGYCGPSEHSQDPSATALRTFLKA